MCIFFGDEKINLVTGTRIFARSTGGADQHLVYAMSVDFPVDTAMVLPLPTPVGAMDDEVCRFVDLQAYPEFFDDLETCIEGEFVMMSGDPVSVALPVLQVGDFEASFVPTQADFERLDPRFRADPELWSQLSEFHDYSFAVFQLSAAASGNEVTDFHPMALTFKRRDPEQIYFPTVHVHDGQRHSEAEFDHKLYLQCSSDEAQRVDAWSAAEIDKRIEEQKPREPKRWFFWRRRKEGPDRRQFAHFGWEGAECEVASKVDLSRCKGLVSRDQLLFRLHLWGNRENVDIVV